MRTWSLWIVAIAVLSGCYRYVVNRPNGNIEGFKETKTYYAFWWGFKQPNIPTKVCERSNALAYVRTSTNFGFALITIASAGIVSPMRVEFICAEQETQWSRCASGPQPTDPAHAPARPAPCAPPADSAGHGP
jgi:hypothetical protein